MSVHRIIQLEFRNTLSPEAQKQFILITSRLLLEAFPKQVNGLSLRKVWPRCEAYIKHVIALARMYEELGLEVQSPREYSDLTECLSNAGW
jgi:hypothetical protein